MIPAWVPRVAGRYLTAFILAVWAVGSLVIGATLMASHWYTLPTPDRDDDEVLHALADLRPPGADGKLHAVHVLYTECRCSQRVFDHLFETERPEGIAETVVLVGDAPEIEDRARASGFTVLVLTPAGLRERLHVESAPLLLVMTADERLVYAGGYSERKQGYEIRDLEILAAMQRGLSAAELPLYGCGVSKRLQDVLDPAGIKYR